VQVRSIEHRRVVDDGVEPVEPGDGGGHDPIRRAVGTQILDVQQRAIGTDLVDEGLSQIGLEPIDDDPRPLLDGALRDRAADTGAASVTMMTFPSRRMNGVHLPPMRAGPDQAGVSTLLTTAPSCMRSKA
jgi:hypothetical protein